MIVRSRLAGNPGQVGLGVKSPSAGKRNKTMYNSSHEYGASVLVNRRPVKEVIHKGDVFIEGRSGSTYSLLFRNNSPHRVKVIPSVDGLCVLDGKPAHKKSRGYLVESKSSIEIPGWRVDRETAAKFQFIPQESNKPTNASYVESIGGDTRNQGTIGFMVFREESTDWDWSRHPYGDSDHISIGVREMEMYDSGTIRNSSPYYVFDNSYAEPKLMGSGITRTLSSVKADPNRDWLSMDEDKSLGTSFGKSTRFKTRKEEFVEADPDNPDAVLVFYYDTMKGLKRKGIPVEAFKKPEKYTNRPNPFPCSPEVMNDGCTIPTGWKR